VCVCVFVCACVWWCVCVCVCVRACACVRARLCLSVYVLKCVYTYMCVYIYADGSTATVCVCVIFAVLQCILQHVVDWDVLRCMHTVLQSIQHVCNNCVGFSLYPRVVFWNATLRLTKCGYYAPVLFRALQSIEHVCNKLHFTRVNETYTAVRCQCINSRHFTVYMRVMSQLVCMTVCVYVCVYTCAWVLVCVCVCVCLCQCVCVCVYTSRSMCMYLFIHILRYSTQKGGGG